MKDKQDYIRDITEIRSMMERSSKFLFLSGWAGILAGVYALSGAYVAYKVFGFNPDGIEYSRMQAGEMSPNLQKAIFLAVLILVLALCTAVFFSYQRARKKGEKLWNATARQLLLSMAVPFMAGGLLILILISYGLIGLIAPLTLLFYGLSLYNGSKFTYDVVKVLGLTQIALGLISAYFIGYGLLFWALGFGVAHIFYGIYVYYRYER
ncbi:hypothetical protein [Rufibacter sp. XAAS-G3-1]|uniref:hypothetical protein n=1 Tax=Rufibacter sp. XAAS-G3-1 TaxID=2729134 RepID=UPI0015E6A80A|nr:hypothetical protein [Rufibacter sp. XAAS-G3-1]